MGQIKFLILVALFVFSSSCAKKNENSSVDNNLGEFHDIKSFLGFRKGMSSIEVIKLLDSKSIKHSGVISSNKLKNGEDFNPDQYKKSQITFIEVFEYPIGENILDKYHLFFINDILYHFSFFRGFSSKTTFNGQPLNKGWVFRSKYGSIAGFINKTLIEKYGQPYVSSNLEGITVDSPDLNLDLELNLKDKLNTRSSYSVIWRPTNEDDLRIYIDNLQELTFSDKMIFYRCSFQILVDFSNEKIDEIIKQWELEEERINKQIEKEKNQKERKFKNDI